MKKMKAPKSMKAAKGGYVQGPANQLKGAVKK